MRGQQWRDRLGGPTFTVVGVDRRFVYVKLSSEPKKNLATKAGAGIVARAEFDREWRRQA